MDRCRCINYIKPREFYSLLTDAFFQLQLRKTKTNVDTLAFGRCLRLELRLKIKTNLPGNAFSRRTLLLLVTSLLDGPFADLVFFKKEKIFYGWWCLSKYLVIQFWFIGLGYFVALTVDLRRGIEEEKLTRMSIYGKRGRPIVNQSLLRFHLLQVKTSSP